VVGKLTSYLSSTTIVLPTNPADLAKIGPVDVEIIGLTEIDKNKEVNVKQRRAVDRANQMSPYSITERRVPELIRFLAVSLQVMCVINPAVGCHYFSPGLQLPQQP